MRLVAGHNQKVDIASPSVTLWLPNLEGGFKCERLPASRIFGPPNKCSLDSIV